jgi:hypothetical protein
MHYPIKSFYLTGTITGDTFVAARERMIQEVEGSMRDEGYVPIIDFPVNFTREFNADTGDFTFELTVCGAYIGEEESWLVGAVMNGRKLPRSTHQTK